MVLLLQDVWCITARERYDRGEHLISLEHLLCAAHHLIIRYVTWTFLIIVENAFNFDEHHKGKSGRVYRKKYPSTRARKYIKKEEGFFSKLTTFFMNVTLTSWRLLRLSEAARLRGWCAQQ